MIFIIHVLLLCYLHVLHFWYFNTTPPPFKTQTHNKEKQTTKRRNPIYKIIRAHNDNIISLRDTAFDLLELSSSSERCPASYIIKALEADPYETRSHDTIKTINVYKYGSTGCTNTGFAV